MIEFDLLQDYLEIAETGNVSKFHNYFVHRWKVLDLMVYKNHSIYCTKRELVLAVAAEDLVTVDITEIQLPTLPSNLLEANHWKKFHWKTSSSDQNIMLVNENSDVEKVVSNYLSIYLEDMQDEEKWSIDPKIIRQEIARLHDV